MALCIKLDDTMTKVKETNKIHLGSSPFICYLEKHENSKRMIFSNLETLNQSTFVPVLCSLDEACSKRMNLWNHSGECDDAPINI